MLPQKDTFRIYLNFHISNEYDLFRVDISFKKRYTVQIRLILLITN